jgi:hypothetical protein
LGPAFRARYRVFSADPARALALVALLEHFGSARDLGLHLLGDGHSLAFVMGEATPPHYVTVLARAEPVLQALVLVARSL